MEDQGAAEQAADWQRLLVGTCRENMDLNKLQREMREVDVRIEMWKMQSEKCNVGTEKWKLKSGKLGMISRNRDKK